MCSRDKEFTIKGTENCLARGYDRTGFFEVDTGEQRAWTVQLTEANEQPAQRVPGIPGTVGPGGPGACRVCPIRRAERLRARLVCRQPPRPEASHETSAPHQDPRHAWPCLFRQRDDPQAVRGRRRRVPHQYEPHPARQDARAGQDHPQCRDRATAARSAFWSICRGRSCGSARSPKARSSSRTARASCSIPTRPRATTDRVQLPHPEILAALRPGHALLLDDGKVRLIAEETSPERAVTRVVIGGKMSDRKGVSLPDTDLPVSAMTPKDRADLEAALVTGDRLDRAVLRAARRGRQRGQEADPRPRRRDGQDREAAGDRPARRNHRGLRRADGGARRSRRRTAAGAGAEPAEADDADGAARRQAGGGRDPDAGIDDPVAGADPRRGLRRRDRRLRRRRRHHAVGGIRRPANSRSRRSRP